MFYQALRLAFIDLQRVQSRLAGFELRLQRRQLHALLSKFALRPAKIRQADCNRDPQAQRKRRNQKGFQHAARARLVAPPPPRPIRRAQSVFGFHVRRARRLQFRRALRLQLHHGPIVGRLIKSFLIGLKLFSIGLPLKVGRRP